MRSFVVIALLLCACNPEQVAHPTPPPSEPVRSQTLNSQDRDFLERAAQGNNGEIAIGSLVEGRAEIGAVLAFGQRMVAEHGAANRELDAIAKQYNIALPTSLGDHQAGYDRLVERKGQSFDQEFMKVMIGDHQQTVELYRNYLSGATDVQLKAYASSKLPITEAHLAHAQSMGKVAEPVQEGSKPVDPRAKTIPPRSTVKQEP